MTVFKNKLNWFLLTMVLLPLLFSTYAIIMRNNFIFLIVYLVLGLVTFTMYVIDKNRAISQQWRIPEFTLHILELLGGWVGGFLAQQFFRHKNKKLSYQLIFWSIVGIHMIGWVFYVIYLT